MVVAPRPYYPHRGTSSTATTPVLQRPGEFVGRYKVTVPDAVGRGRVNITYAIDVEQSSMPAMKIALYTVSDVDSVLEIEYLERNIVKYA